jgi:hypothetical protein
MAKRTKLAEDPSKGLRTEIVCHFWRKQKDTVNIQAYNTYFEYYNTTCRALLLGVACTELESLSITTHEDLLDMIDALWKLSETTPNFDRPQLRAELLKIPTHIDQPLAKVNNSINFLFRLWLTVRIQEPDFSPAARSFQWDDSSMIKNFLMRNFPEPRSNRLESEILLESDFTAVNLFRMCGIRVNWTNQLEDHLLYDVETRTVSIYSLGECLQDHLSWSVSFWKRAEP